MDRPRKHNTEMYKEAYKAMTYISPLKQVFPDFRSKSSRGIGTNKLKAESK